MIIKVFNKECFLFFIYFLILIISRLNTSLLNINVYNPDEYQLVANAIKFSYYGIDLNFFDGYSLGLYNAIILYLPNVIGFEYSIFVVRLTGLILIIFSSYFIYKTIVLISTKTLAKTYISLTIIFFSFTKDQDFLCFNGEILFCLVFSIILYLITNIWYKNNIYKNYQFCFIGILSSSIFFIKLQFIIYLCLLFIIFIFSYLKKKISLNNLLYFIIGLISHVLIVFIFFNVDFYNFFINNFLRSLDYISQSNDIISLEKNISKSVLNVKKIKPFFYHLKFNLIFHYFYLLFLTFLFFLYVGKKNIFIKKNYELLIIYILIFISISISILIPGKMYRHYLYPLIFLSPVISAYSYNFLANKISINEVYYKILFVIVFLILVTSGLLENKKYYALEKSKILKIDIKNLNKNFKLFDFLTNSQLKTAFVWGWMPEWYLMGGLSPVTSETTTEHQLNKNKLNAYFTNRTKKEIFKNYPDIVIDGVRGKSFVYNNPNDNFENFLNEDRDKFLKNYFKITNQFKKNNCPIFYINNKFKKNFEKIIDIKSIIFKNKKENNKLKNILDFSITEDTCDDAFEIEKENNSEITILFDKAELLESISLLNNKKSMHKVPNKRTVILSFFYNEEFKKNVTINLNKYPYWNKLSFEEDLRINRVDINIKDSSNENLGLNEIIFIKK